MEIVLYALGIAALAAGVAGVVLPALPGSPLLVVGVVLVAWADGFERVGWPTIAVAAVLAISIMAVDWVAAWLGAKAFGASRWAALGAAAGLVVGLFLGLAGIVLGPAVGAVAFEYWKNPELGRAAKAGLGVLLGFLVGSAVKVALAFTIVGVLLTALVV